MTGAVVHQEPGVVLVAIPAGAAGRWHGLLRAGAETPGTPRPAELGPVLDALARAWRVAQVDAEAAAVVVSEPVVERAGGSDVDTDGAAGARVAAGDERWPWPSAITVAEAVELCGRSDVTVRKRLGARQLRGRKLPDGKWLVDRDDLERRVVAGDFDGDAHG